MPTITAHIARRTRGWGTVKSLGVCSPVLGEPNSSDPLKATKYESIAFCGLGANSLQIGHVMYGIGSVSGLLKDKRVEICSKCSNNEELGLKLLEMIAK